MRHSGLNAAETGTPPLSLAWTRDLARGAQYNGVSIAKGRVLATVNDFGAKLVALSASDGSTLWSFSNQAGSFGNMGAPAAFGDEVFLGFSGNYNNTKMWKFDLGSGTLAWTAPFDSQWENYWPPIVVDQTLYFNGGTYGGLYGSNVADGTQQFFQSLDQYDAWSPAYFNGKIYTFVNGHFRAHDAATGAIAWTVELGWTWSGYTLSTSPVFGAKYGYAISASKLHAVDPVTQAVAWSVNGFYTGMPAVADGVVYGISAGNLLARDALSGALLWTFAGDGSLTSPIVIANGYVYVGSAANTFAVSIATHSQVWTVAAGGTPSIGDHRLIIWNGERMNAYAFTL